MIKFLVQVSRYFPTCPLFQATWKQDKAVISSSVKSSTGEDLPESLSLWKDLCGPHRNTEVDCKHV